MERLDTEHPDIRMVYKTFSSKQHAAMIRNDLAWDEYWRWDLDDLTAAVYYDDSHQPQGYLLYWISEDVLHIKEMVYNNQETRNGLWNFISAHFSMVTKVVGSTYTNDPLAFWLDDGEIKETITSLLHGSYCRCQTIYCSISFQGNWYRYPNNVYA